jgi:hypothetical protein
MQLNSGPSFPSLLKSGERPTSKFNFQSPSVARTALGELKVNTPTRNEHVKKSAKFALAPVEVFFSFPVLSFLFFFS